MSELHKIEITIQGELEKENGYHVEIGGKQVNLRLDPNNTYTHVFDEYELDWPLKLFIQLRCPKNTPWEIHFLVDDKQYPLPGYLQIPVKGESSVIIRGEMSKPPESK